VQIIAKLEVLGNAHNGLRGEETSMPLSAPTMIVFAISVIVAIVGVLVGLNVFAFGVAAFWIVTVAFVLLALGNLLKGM
jgi:uncharacterized membrane protein YhhN